MVTFVASDPAGYEIFMGRWTSRLAGPFLECFYHENRPRPASRTWIKFRKPSASSHGAVRVFTVR